MYNEGVYKHRGSMKINTKVLSIPPYISTSWENVSSLNMDEDNITLIVVLKSGKQVSIPKLSSATLNDIFVAHADFLDQNPQNTLPTGSLANLGQSLNIGLAPGQLGMEGLENFTGMMQHDPNQKNAPPLPKEILEKISNVAKALGLDAQAFNIPGGEPHCNCPYCQISKAMHGNLNLDNTPDITNYDEDDTSTDSDLLFREWDITQLNDKLYDVVSALDNAERYQVYLGKPIGCTCGKNNCEHVIAVLKS